MRKILRIILVISAVAYLLILGLQMYAQWNHIPNAAIIISIGMYVRIFFYVYLILYIVYYLLIMSKARNK